MLSYVIHIRFLSDQYDTGGFPFHNLHRVIYQWMTVCEGFYRDAYIGGLL